MFKDVGKKIHKKRVFLIDLCLSIKGKRTILTFLINAVTVMEKQTTVTP